MGDDPRYRPRSEGRGRGLGWRADDFMFNDTIGAGYAAGSQPLDMPVGCFPCIPNAFDPMPDAMTEALDCELHGCHPGQRSRLKRRYNSTFLARGSTPW